MIARTLILGAAAAATLLAGTAQAAQAAAPLTGVQVLNQFGEVILGNATSTAATQGRAWVGGDVSGGQYASTIGAMPASAYAGLSVQGKATGATSNRGIASGNDVPRTTNFASVLGNLSQGLSKLAGNSQVAVSGKDVIFNAAPVNGVAVFDLTKLGADGHQLDDTVFGAASIRINMNGATSIIINSDNANISVNARFIDTISRGAKTIWNFYGASMVDLGAAWGGSVLATGAAFSNAGTVDGGVYARSITQHGDIRLVPFGGALPALPAVPEPASYAMLLAGLGLIGMLARRRKLAASTPLA
jgi:hypothetical protein